MTTPATGRFRGLKTVLVALYGVLTLAALGRSSYQIIRSSPDVPLAFWLSALAALVYLIATISLGFERGIGRKIAWVSISFELLGVLVVGTISLIAPALLGQDHTQLTGDGATVWTGFGLGYLLIPLLLPVLGLLWLSRSGKALSVQQHTVQQDTAQQHSAQNPSPEPDVTAVAE
ncbi:MAG: hypothetical protein WBA28_04130 [Microbacteriaceae bacterium]